MLRKRWTRALPVALTIALTIAFLLAVLQPSELGEARGDSSRLIAGSFVVSVPPLAPEIESLPELVRVSVARTKTASPPTFTPSHGSPDVRADVSRTRPHRHVPRFDDDDH